MHPGGIDGKGIVHIRGLLSFHMLFQCKRCQGLGSSENLSGCFYAIWPRCGRNRLS